MLTGFCRFRWLIVIGLFSWCAVDHGGQSSQVAAQSAPESEPYVKGIEAILATAYSTQAPGACVIVTRGDQVVYQGARGLADLELNVPLQSDMVFRVGSITKQFTAAAIMMLVEDGKLSLQDEITKFLPDYPTQNHKITVEHLLTHTSGIMSYTNIPGWMLTRVKQDLTVDQLIDGFKDKPMEFAPGEKYKYNNSGYVLLGAIIEKVSGQTYREFIDERIFKPLGMQQSYYGSHSLIIPKRARGYDGSPEQPQNAQYLSMTQPYSAGSLLSTVGDLARWNDALFSGKVVNQDSLAKMTTPYQLSDGSATGYGYGLGISDVRGHRAIAHGGGIFGFSTYGTYLPEHDIYVAVLSNSTSLLSNPRVVSKRIAALVAVDPYPSHTAIELPAERLKQYVGVYRIDEQTTRTVTVRNGRLYTQRTGSTRMEAFPHADDKFFYTHSLSYFEFVRDDQGQVIAMRMYPDGGKDAELATKTDEMPVQRKIVRVDPNIYDDYEGEYEMAPGVVLTISRDGDRLMGHVTGQAKLQLLPTSETEFFVSEIDAELNFVRADDGSVNIVVMKRAGREVKGVRKQ